MLQLTPKGIMNFSQISIEAIWIGLIWETVNHVATPSYFIGE